MATFEFLRVSQRDSVHLRGITITQRFAEVLFNKFTTHLISTPFIVTFKVSLKNKPLLSGMYNRFFTTFY